MHGLELGTDVFEVPDARADPRFADNRLVTDDPRGALLRRRTLRHGPGPALGCGVRAGLRAALMAEGVETAQQRDALVDLGCRLGQGFLYSCPLPRERVSAWHAAGA